MSTEPRIRRRRTTEIEEEFADPAPSPLDDVVSPHAPPPCACPEPAPLADAGGLRDSDGEE